MNIESLKIPKNDKIESLKNQLNSEKSKKKNIEKKYNEILEQFEMGKLCMIEENRILKNEYEFMLDETIYKEKQSALGTFTAMLFHDLKNPLSDIQNITELLELEAGNNKSLISLADLLNVASKKMNQLIGDTLGLIRKTPLNLERVNVKSMFEHVIENHGILKDVKVLLLDSSIEIECDKSKMESVFTNIINNSAQAMNHKGTIKIEISENSISCVITIEDSGKGIPEDVMKKMFQPLFTTKQEGTGLGLAICNNILNQHNGKISVKNNPTTFTIQLPKKSNQKS